MEFVEQNCKEVDAKPKWKTRFDRLQQCRPSNTSPIFSFSNLKREAQLRFRQQLYQELTTLRQSRERSANSLAQLRERQQVKQTQLEEVNLKFKAMQIERQRLETLKKNYVEEIQKKYTAFLTAKNFYKVKLNIYYIIEELLDESGNDNFEIVLEFFKCKKSSNRNYSVTLQKKKNEYKLIEMKPMLSNFEKLAHRLDETNDVLGFLSCVRYCFQIFANHT